MKIVKCWNCGTRFLRVDGLHYDDTKGLLTQDTTCPKCGRTVVTTWKLTTHEKLGIGIALGLLFDKSQLLFVRHGVAFYAAEKKPTATTDPAKLEKFFADAKRKGKAQG